MTPSRQLTLDFPHRPALGREDFLVGPANEVAVAWIDRWPDWPAPALVVYGPPGCGKTHLAHVWRGRSGARMLAVAELAGRERIPALAADGCCILDAWPAEGGEERGLLHLYNLLSERGGHLLVTSRLAPSHWRLGLADLASRMRAVPAVSISAPDDALLAAVLVKLFHDRQIHIGDDVLGFLLARMERSLEAAQGLVAALDRAAMAAQRRITIPLAREVLRHYHQHGTTRE